MGGKIIAAITWSQVELDGLLEDEESRVHYERAQRHLGLHPFHLTDLNAALREILTATLNKYDAKSKGIVLSYKNPKFLTKMGTLIYDSCYIHIDVEAVFYVFRPNVGDTLKGIVNKKSEDHVGLLVHKSFNVTIPRPNGDRNWPGRSIQIGQEVRFTVTCLDFKGRLPYIRGSLDAEDYLRGCRFSVEVKSNKTQFASDGEEEPEEVLEDGAVEDSGIDEKVSPKKPKKVKRETENDGSRKIKRNHKPESEVVEEYLGNKKPSKPKSENGEDKAAGKKKKGRVKAEEVLSESEADGFEASRRDSEEEILPPKSKKRRRESSGEEEGRSSLKTKSKAKVKVETLNSEGDSDFQESAKSDTRVKDESARERMKKRHKIKAEIFSSETEESDVNRSKRSKRKNVECSDEGSKKKRRVKAEVLSSEAESVANETNHDSRTVNECSGEKSKKRRRIKAEVPTPETYD